MRTGLWTIPNMLSIFRILLIPLIVQLYLKGYYFYTGMVLILSAFTDMLDGYIARNYHQTSDMGKILDPVADKLTQVTMAAAFVLTYPSFFWILMLLLVKELYMSVAGVILIRKGGKPFGSCWWGKLSTVLLYVYMISMMLFDPEVYHRFMITGGVVVVAALLFSMIKYVEIHRDKFRELKNNREQTDDSDA